MKMTIRQLKETIKFHWGGADKSFLDDHSYAEASILVPQSSKDVVKRWAKHMKLVEQYNLDREDSNNKAVKESR